MEFHHLRLLPTCLIIILLVLQYRLWFESGGVLDMIHLKKQLVSEQLYNEKLKKRNQALFSQIERLQKNQETVESRARRELGMIKKGETYYQIISK